MTDLIEQTTAEAPPGYWIDPKSGAWCTLPWPADRDEKQRLADSSLGPLLIRWAENRLTDAEFNMFGPGLIHHEKGSSWRFTDGQKRFLILWYAYNERGRWLYRSGVKRGSKGTGKDPFAGAIGNIELAGPSQLAWDGDRWVGQQHRMPLVQIAANSEDQARKALRVASGMWSREARDWHGLDCGDTRIVLKGGRGRFETLTASEASSEGNPATFIILNESQHMTYTSGGHRLADVAQRNVGKSPSDLQARLLELTNAHGMGMDSIAERSFVGWQDQVSGRTIGKRDILYDSIEADPNLSIRVPEQLDLALTQAYSDAPWADLERLRDEILDPRMSEAQSIRFYLNGLAVREDAWIDPQRWKALTRSDLVLNDRDEIAMFLDCSKSGDATGIVAVRISDGYTLTLGVWSPPRGGRNPDWLVPRHEVDAVVREAFSRYRVLWFGVDPSPATDDDTEALYWKPMIDGWHRDFNKKVKLWATKGETYGHSVLFDMRLSQRGAHERLKQFTEMAEQVAIWVDDEQAFFHDGHDQLTRHVHNARRRPNQWGTSLGKESRDSKNHVDLAVCMVGAHLGRQLILNNTKIRTGRSGRSSRREAVLL